MPQLLDRCDCGARLRVFTQTECLSCGRLSLYDVENVAGFIADAIKDGKARLSPLQREEMMAEGRQIMLRLAQQYAPGKGGRDVNGSRFSGFAAKYLRLKLSDAYARVVERDDPEGDPALRPALSLDAFEETPAHVQAAYDSTVDDWERQIDAAAALEKQYLRLVTQNVDQREAAQLMRLDAAEVASLAERVRLALDPERAVGKNAAPLHF